MSVDPNLGTRDHIGLAPRTPRERDGQVVMRQVVPYARLNSHRLYNKDIDSDYDQLVGQEGEYFEC